MLYTRGIANPSSFHLTRSSSLSSATLRSLLRRSYAAAAETPATKPVQKPLKPTVREGSFFSSAVKLLVGGWFAWDVGTSLVGYKWENSKEKELHVLEHVPEIAQALRDPKVRYSLADDVAPVSTPKVWLEKKGHWRYFFFDHLIKEDGEIWFTLKSLQYIGVAAIVQPVKGKKLTGSLSLQLRADDRGWQKTNVCLALPSDKPGALVPDPICVPVSSVPLDKEGVPFRYHIKKFW